MVNKSEIDNKESSDKKRKPEDIVNFAKLQSKIGRVDSLDDDGFPYVGANLQSGDIIIGKGAESGADNSVKLKHTERIQNLCLIIYGLDYTLHI